MELTSNSGLVTERDHIKFVQNNSKTISSDKPANSCALVAAANRHCLIWVGYNDKTIRAIDVSETQDRKIAIGDIQFTQNLTFTPKILSIPQNGFSSILLVIGHDNYPVLEFFNIDTKTTISKVDLPDLQGTEIIDHAWHPIYQTSIVALVTRSGTLLIVGLNVNEKNANVVYREQKFGATTCCWSPKGKNLAMGTSQGTIVRIELVIDATQRRLSFKELGNGTIKVPMGQITPEHLIVKLFWITNKYIVSLHAKLRGEYSDSIYSLVPIKPNEPVLCWPGVPAERCDPNYSAQILSLANILVCFTSYSTEALILGVFSGGKVTESKDWECMTIEDEKLELALDDDNEETLPRGVAMVKTNNQLALVVYNSSGVLCPYTIVSTDPSVQMANLQEFVDCPVSIPRPMLPTPVQQTSTFPSMMKPSAFQASPQSPFQTSTLSQSLQQPQQQSTFQMSPSTFQLSQSNFQLSPASFQTKPLSLVNQSPQAQAPQLESKQQQQQPTLSALSTQLPIPTKTAQPQQPQQQQQQQQPPSLPQQQQQQQQQSQPAPLQLTKQAPPKPIQLPDLNKNIQELKKKIEFNDMFLTLLEDLNQLRDQLEEIQEIHKIHVEVLEAIKKDIDSLDLGMLENLYLVEYIKSRIKGAAIKKSLDPLTSKKMENIRQNLRVISEKLRDLDINVDVAWEDFVRSKASSGKKQLQRSPFNSIELIYKTMATNQKIIDILKSKVRLAPKKADKSLESEVGAHHYDSSVLVTRREMDPNNLAAFERFLSSRSQVPVRRPVK